MEHEPAPRNDLPRRSLSRIVAGHGREICGAPKRLEALLRDLCGAHRREINVIMGAHEERVAADLIAAGKSVPRGVLLARLAARLRDNLAYTPEAARWGVETWAVALGVLSEAELRERARAEQSEASRGTAAQPVRDSEPPAPERASAPQTTKPQRGTAYAPPPQPQPQPKRNSATTPPIFHPPAPRRPQPTPPKAAAPPAPARNLPPPPVPRFPARRGPKLRSCLIVVALIFALIVAAVFAIPAVLVLLQEEQSRPSINEPRIR